MKTFILNALTCFSILFMLKYYNTIYNMKGCGQYQSEQYKKQ